MPNPATGGMPLEQKAAYLVGRPVGFSLRSGQGASAKLCGVQGGEAYVLQYLYASQFATFHYPFDQINAIYPYPDC
ncbi:hypothetical protein SAMN02799624_04891 [Paenibacillus sp. UNC496MF]|uniref:hypothetical protein n=1 Tax=Paenibacillus sp. UNC496MF TaxID=1502753 RepID=UPI0008E677A8|nr:hypothetical protein [Paenibacillus sp. UNC496MF]SFJ52374.1 hypothetical protein SAMN02799624_04891 [Paenibacillus sp. UNC496MF]